MEISLLSWYQLLVHGAGGVTLVISFGTGCHRGISTEQENKLNLSLLQSVVVYAYANG